MQTATLIVAFGLIVQGCSVWKLKHALRWSKRWPFLAGAVIGVPVGIFILGWANPAHVKTGIGTLLVLYSLYALVRPNTRSFVGLGVKGAVSADTIRMFLFGLPALLAGIWLGQSRATATLSRLDGAATNCVTVA